jgi:hypothetical protein
MDEAPDRPLPVVETLADILTGGAEAISHIHHDHLAAVRYARLLWDHYGCTVDETLELEEVPNAA